jgi:hypothetical protein
MLWMKRTAIFLTAEQLKKLAELKIKTGVPVAEQIRRAIDVYLLKAAKIGPRKDTNEQSIDSTRSAPSHAGPLGF